MPPESPNLQIVLTLRGARAEHGVALSDFENFIDAFLAALRDFDRERRGAPTRKTGHPEKRAELMSAFRLVAFRPGSGIATLEPLPSPGLDHAENGLFEDALPQVENLRALVQKIHDSKPLPGPVTASLERACRSLGDDGTVVVAGPSVAAESVLMTVAKLRALGAAESTSVDETVTSVSGRLHFLDLEPDRIAIRSSNGVDWRCTYPEDMEQRILRLAGKVVWVEGEGCKTSPKGGRMTITRIDELHQGEQTALFSFVPLSTQELLERHGVETPPGLERLADPDWDPSDDTYLAALTRT